MKAYEVFKAEILMLNSEDVVTASADFQDATTGDNGVWFPGSTQGGTQWNN